MLRGRAGLRDHVMLFSVALLALFASVQGRAVNISNTWVLPEEGFPVFYRYFRDRISWYEADAVCQFHHANLVTVDATAQYDAVRAYLKELDISTAVWVGLIRSNPSGDFTWTDYRGLSGDGYWSSAPDSRDAPLCAAADPSADYRWRAQACGGPTVASFICELPVPQWALGSEGCMVRALPALTILYLPESAAVQLTADCGLAGVKRIHCTGNMKRQDLLRDLSCAEVEEVSTTVNFSSSGTTWPSTTDIVFTDQDTTTEITTEENPTSNNSDDPKHSTTEVLSSTIGTIHFTEYEKPTKTNPIDSKFNRNANVVRKDFDLTSNYDNNLQSNHIPKIPNSDNYLSNEQLDKIEDEKRMQHKMLHEEIARLGNLENIFTQPTDHFVPPLVMAKAKISTDMTVLSLQEKHAQQIAEKHNTNENIPYKQIIYNTDSFNMKLSTIEPTVNNLSLMQVMKSKDDFKKDKNKTTVPKKYNEKMFEPKSKIQKTIESKPAHLEQITITTISQTDVVTKVPKTTPLPWMGRLTDDDDSVMNLTVLIKDVPDVTEEKSIYNYNGDMSQLVGVEDNTGNNETEVKFYDVDATDLIKLENVNQNSTSNRILNITVISGVNTLAGPAVAGITPNKSNTSDNVSITPMSLTFRSENDTNAGIVTESTIISYPTTLAGNVSTELAYPDPENDTKDINTEESSTFHIVTTTTIELLNTSSVPLSKNSSIQDNVLKENVTTNDTYATEIGIIENFSADVHEEFESASNSSDIDDFNSPLLSGASEPLRKPGRSRRPQPPSNRSKFNPFRILG